MRYNFVEYKLIIFNYNCYKRGMTSKKEAL